MKIILHPEAFKIVSEQYPEIAKHQCVAIDGQTDYLNEALQDAERKIAKALSIKEPKYGNRESRK
jgi:hypothetical protein